MGKFVSRYYVFDASAKTVQFTAFTSGSLKKEQIALITNMETGDIIFFFKGGPGLSGTLTADAGGDILTLDFDTTSMNDTDALRIDMEDFIGDYSTSNELVALVNLFPTSIGQKAKAASLAVTLASDEDTLPVVEDNSAAIKTAVESIAGEDFATAAKQDTGNTSLASIVTAVQLIDNFISGARGLVTEDNSAAIKTAVETIDNFISGSRGLVTEDNSAAIKTAVEVIDNFISGSRGLVTEDNSSAISSGIGATADAIVAAGAAGSLNAKLRRATQGLEDLKSLIVLAAGDNNIGNVDVVTLPGVAGDVAHDAGDSGSPVKVGAKATNALPTAVANGDRTNNISDLWGRQLTSHVDPAMQVAITKTSFNATTTQTGAAMWTPASGKRIALTSLIIGTYGTTAARVIIWIGASGDTTFNEGTDHCVFKASYAPSATVKPGSVYTPSLKPVYSQTADHILKITTDAGISIDVTWDGYEF